MTSSTFVAPLIGPETARVRVLGTEHGFCVVAVDTIDIGEQLFQVRGSTTSVPSRYSIQIDDQRHIALGPEVTIEEAAAHHPWRFVNHSCDPNAAYAARAFVAIRPIAAGEPVTYNYNTTEFDLAGPFECHCGSPTCLSTIRGFAHLALAEQTRLAPWLADHLRRRLDPAPPYARE